MMKKYIDQLVTKIARGGSTAEEEDRADKSYLYYDELSGSGEETD